MELQRIGPYRLERKLGAGGMGVVHAAWDERLHRRVALKQIRPEMAGDPLRRERFRREARIVAQLDHPSIVHIHDLLETPEGDWLVLQYVDGPTLAQRLRQGPLPPWQLVTVAQDLLGALEAAHSRGMLHRDLKTENVLLAPSGRAMVLDFGLAKLYGQESGAASAGAITGTAAGTAGVVGTYRAMSPEQAHGLPLDPRSDLFSLGVLLYEAATGVSPFQAETPLETLTRVCTHLQQPARERASAVPEPLSTLIDALLEKDADRRPRSAGEAFLRIAEGPLTTRLPPPDADRTLSIPPLPPLAVCRAPRSDRPVSVKPCRGFRTRHQSLLLGFVLVLGLNLPIAGRLHVPHPAVETLHYVAAARPQVGIGAGREEVALAATAVQETSLRAVASLREAAALASGPPEPGEPALPFRRLSRQLAAEEVQTSTICCQASHCRIVLRVERRWGGELPYDLAPLLAELEQIGPARRCSAYLLAATVERRRFFDEAERLSTVWSDSFLVMSEFCSGGPC